jgi:hypothetical protein
VIYAGDTVQRFTLSSYQIVLLSYWSGLAKRINASTSKKAPESAIAVHQDRATLD